jgi:hypothetical protein
LPDTDGQGFVALNGSFEAENRSLNDQTRSGTVCSRGDGGGHDRGKKKVVCLGFGPFANSRSTFLFLEDFISIEI